MGADTPVPYGWRRSAERRLGFRPISDDDELLFAGRVYASVRKDYLADLPWQDVQKAAFLLLQFRAQHARYLQEYPEADRLLISRGEVDIGRLYIDRQPDQLRIIDIALMPAHRHKGTGEAILRDLMDEAASCGSVLSVEVDKTSPAMRLFRRLGFTVEADRGDCDLLRWASA
jgi:ribosomal protein S18 acetylase RimI-like enzyme